MSISIIKHGAPFVVQNENRISSGASQSSDLLKSIRYISNSHEKINFVSCYSANGGFFSNAQMLANASGSPVTGYYGKINKLTANLDNSGRTFRPQHKIISRICSAGNRLLSGPIQVGVGLKHLVTSHSDGNIKVKHNVNKTYFQAETPKKLNGPVSHAKSVGFAKIQSLSSKGCSEDQSKIIHTYTRNQTLFNNYLKQGIDIDNPLNKDAKQLNSALDALPNSTEITYRGFSTEKNVYGKQIVEGDIVKNNLFMSTSLSSVYAKQYASSATSEGVFFEVYGRTGKNISMHSHFQGAKGEAEFLFKPGINFEVKSIKSKGNIKYVVIKEITLISDSQANIKNIFNGERLPSSQSSEGFVE